MRKTEAGIVEPVGALELSLVWGLDRYVYTHTQPARAIALEIDRKIIFPAAC